MKIAPFTAALAAVITVGSVASPVMAQDYRYAQGPSGDAAYACQTNKHQSQATGGVFGALLGAVIGSNLAAHGGGRTGGALLGAAAGAAVGSNIGVSSAHNSGACQAAQADSGYYRQVRYDYGYRYDRDAQYREAQYRDAQYRDAQYRDAQYRDAQYRAAQYRDAQYRDAQYRAQYDRGYDGY